MSLTAPSTLPPAARWAVATAAILGCIAVVAVVALAALRYVHWNWASLLLAAVAIILAVVGMGLLLDTLEHWVEQNGGKSTKGAATRGST